MQVTPALLGRAVVGHLLAASNETQAVNAPNVVAMRNYFLDRTLSFPDGARIHLWPYPDHMEFVSAGHAAITTHGNVLVYTLKFYPLAFMVAWDSNPDWALPGVDITALLQENSGQPRNLDLPLDRVPTHFPELPSGNNGILVTMVGDETIRYSVPYRKS